MCYSGAVLNFKLPAASLDGSEDSAKARLFALVSSLRVFRVFIAAWNGFVLVSGADCRALYYEVHEFIVAPSHRRFLCSFGSHDVLLCCRFDDMRGACSCDPSRAEAVPHVGKVLVINPPPQPRSWACVCLCVPEDTPENVLHRLTPVSSCVYIASKAPVQVGISFFIVLGNLSYSFDFFPTV